MFAKKCKKCGKKAERGHSYCPHCGKPLFEEKDYGMLGKNDEQDLINDSMKLPFGLNFLMKNLMKEMDKQFKGIEDKMPPEKMFKSIQKNPLLEQAGISINISSGQGAPFIKVRSFGNVPPAKNEAKPRNSKNKVFHKALSEEDAGKFANLPRHEAKSKVRRLSGKVEYEIEIPGVKNIGDVVINELGNSIEIKAFSDKKAYFKLLPISLPVLRYSLDNEKLILELGEK